MSEVIGIVGSRDYSSPFDVLTFVQALPLDTLIVSGGAWKGVDKWAADCAVIRGMKTKIFRPLPEDRKECGNCCYHRRNERIVNYVKSYSGRIVAFSMRTPTGEPTAGTKSTIGYAKRYGVPYEIIWDRRKR